MIRHPLLKTGQHEHDVNADMSEWPIAVTYLCALGKPVGCAKMPELSEPRTRDGAPDPGMGCSTLKADIYNRVTVM